jgi:leucyl-tRNA synthetase
MADSNKFNFKKIKQHAQELRNNQTESEKLLWKELRGRKLSGYKFLRQHPILYKGNLIKLNYFIADFFCDEKKVVIEIDGPIHDTSKEYDQFRDTELMEIGLHVLRIKNEELQDMSAVLNRIKALITQIPDIK